jgi:hypothetical protein
MSGLTGACIGRLVVSFIHDLSGGITYEKEIWGFAGSAILLAAICVGIGFAFSYTSTDGFGGGLTQLAGRRLTLTATAGVRSRTPITPSGIHRRDQ